MSDTTTMEAWLHPDPKTAIGAFPKYDSDWMTFHPMGENKSKLAQIWEGSESLISGPEWTIAPYNVLDIPVAPPAPLTGLIGVDPNRAVLTGKFDLGQHEEIETTEEPYRKHRTREIVKQLDLAIASRFIALASLEAGWDGYGGQPTSLDAIEAAVDKLTSINRLFGKLLATPFVAPLPDGSVELEWDLESGKELMIVVPASGKGLRYLFVQPGSPEEAGQLPDEVSLQALPYRLIS